MTAVRWAVLTALGAVLSALGGMVVTAVIVGAFGERAWPTALALGVLAAAVAIWCWLDYWDRRPWR